MHLSAVSDLTMDRRTRTVSQLTEHPGALADHDVLAVYRILGGCSGSERALKHKLPAADCALRALASGCTLAGHLSAGFAIHAAALARRHIEHYRQLAYGGVQDHRQLA